MISLQDVTKTYTSKNQSQVQAIWNVHLEVKQGEFVVITGRSGSGKTTLLNLVAGLTRPTHGTVLLDGVEVWKLPDLELSALRNHKIGFVFQFPSLMPSLSVLENVMLPTLFQPKPNPMEVATQAKNLLEEVGLSDKLNAYPRQLSAGQQQRVVIARSLINHPEILLADEPTSDLDEQTEQEVMSLFRDVHQRFGLTVLLVTHTNELIRYGTRSVRMASGKIVPEPSVIQPA